MKKLGRPQRHIFKIESKRFRTNDWILDLTREDAIKNDELVAVGESEILRIIDKITNGENTKTKQYFQKKDEIELIKQEPTSKENKLKMKKINNEINELLFEKHYIMIVFNTKKDYRVAVKNGVALNGIKYKRLYGTTVGIKKNTIIFVSDEIHRELHNKIECGRDTEIEIVPAKYEAYKSLASSVSTPVRQVSADGILVVHDHVTSFKSDVTEVKPCKNGEPVIQNIKDKEMSMEQSDGNGFITPELSYQFAQDLGENYTPTGFVVRNAFLKGVLYTFPFDEFIEKIAIKEHNKSPYVEDVWGNIVDTRNVRMVLTTSMLKLWKAYNSIQDYIECCKENDFGFSVTKVIPKELENERHMTYQFLQSLYLNDEDIRELAQPTIYELKDIIGGDYRKSILYLRGKNVNEENVEMFDANYIQALMIDKRMINDPFVRYRIHSMLKKAINDAKFGVIRVKGNYSTISGDIYGLAEYIFGIERDGVIGKGLLNADEFYSNYWNEQGVNKVVAMRAPMCTHANIKVMNLKNNEELAYWYRYMPNCTVFNSWDSTCETLSGADKDGDSVITTNNEIIMKGVRELPALICQLDDVKKDIVTEELLQKSNLNGFNNNVGGVTNKATNIRNKMSLFEEDSEEYKELYKREMAIQRIQQSVIDSIKTGKSEKIPKKWYSYFENRIITQEVIDRENEYLKSKGIKEETKLKPDTEYQIEEKKFNLKILADKKPYFMIYVYGYLKYQYKEYVENCNIGALRRFNKTLYELIDLEDKTEDHQKFIDWYERKLPVDMSPSVMNKICWLFEKEFSEISTEISETCDFDYTILMSGSGYNKSNYKQVAKLYSEYKKKLKEYMIESKEKKRDSDVVKSKRQQFVSRFRRKAMEVCTNEEELCNIVVEMCYRTEGSKQFAWDISGRQIIRNLLKKNNNEITYFELDDDGEVQFSGDSFALKTKKVEGEE